MLGLDVHDCAKARAHEYRFGTLREGMVLTVEPGLYFQPDDATVPEALRGIGVRIEDDVASRATAARISPRSCRRAPATSRRGSRSWSKTAKPAVRPADSAAGAAEASASTSGARREAAKARCERAPSLNAGKTLLDRPLTERENQHARQVSDAERD